MAASYEEWRSGTSTSSCFDCLLPTGIHVPLVADRNITLAVLKAALWKEAQKYPFKELLEDAAEYVFVGITSDAPYRQEFYDESRIIADLRLFMPVLQLQEMEGNREEKKASNDISKNPYPLDNVSYDLKNVCSPRRWGGGQIRCGCMEVTHKCFRGLPADVHQFTVDDARPRRFFSPESLGIARVREAEETVEPP